MDGMIQLQLLHQKKNVLPDRKCSLKLSDACLLYTSCLPHRLVIRLEQLGDQELDAVVE